MKIPVTFDIDLDELRDELTTTIVDEAQEERIRSIVRQELSNLLPDIKRALRQDVIEHLTTELRKRVFSQSGPRG